MPNYAESFTPETMRTRSGASLTASYKTIGTAITHPSRQLIIVNNTGILVYISWDGTNDHLPLLAGASLVLDESSNSVSQSVLVTKAKTQFYARDPSNLGTGTDNVYLATFYAA